MNSTSQPPFIPFARPCIGDEEIDAVAEAMRSGWLTTGPRTKAFEDAFAAAVGARHALAVSSATAGLHLAVEAIGIGPDDLVAVPVWTFTSTAEVVRYMGAHPVFIDVEPDTLNLDVAAFARRAAELARSHPGRLKAVMPVHLGGQACEMDAVLDVAGEFGLKVVEDAAHAFPSTTTCRSVGDPEKRRRTVGSIGHASVFSFYATKTIATGEGGMVTTDDDAIAARVRTMRLHGISRDVWNRYTDTKPSWYYEVVAPGFKYNLTDVASSIGLVQLKRAMDLRQRRWDIARAYDAAFHGHPALAAPVPRHADDENAQHLYVLRLNLDRLDIDRDRFIAELTARGIGCSVHFIPLHLHPYWRDRYGLAPSDFPVATREFARVISLPIYPDMDDGMVQRVIDAVLDVAGQHGR